MKKVVYLDNAATTPLRKEVLLAMRPYWDKKFGNPGSITKIGVWARQAVENSRKGLAEVLKARPQEIIFTSGGTESNNLAIFGVVNDLERRRMKISDMHFIATNIEHSSITECFKELERRGAKIDYLRVGENGLVKAQDLRKIIKLNTVLVSVGYANNEIGVIQPIKEIAREIRHARKTNPNLCFHTDASQAGLYCNLNVNELGVDLMTLDAQKIYGPKGIGILFVKTGLGISPIIFGGGQERNLRSGTENVPLIVGQAKALEIIRKGFEKKAKKVKTIRDYFWQRLQKEIPGVVLNGDLKNRLPNNLNISISGIDSAFIVLCLDEAGIVCSTKSTCNHDQDVSVVVKALGRDDIFARATLRFSLTENITKKEIDYVVSVFKKEVEKQRNQTFV